MFEARGFVDLGGDGNSGLAVGDPKLWLSGDANPSSPTHLPPHSASAAAAAANVDRVLFNDLVEIVPLVQSLIDRKPSSSFTRRGSVVYTKTPSRESLSRKVNEPKVRNAAQSIPAKKRRDTGDKEQGRNESGSNQDADNFSIYSSRGLAAEREESVLLRGQVEDLQRKLLEKEELLKSAEVLKNQMNSVHAQVEELKHEASQKDSFIKSIQIQLSDAKIKLADKQAALEKTQWEAMTSDKRVEKLQEELDAIQGDVSLIVSLFEGLTEHDATLYSGDTDINPYRADDLPWMEDLDVTKMQKMEEARQAYILAVAAAKEKQDEESLALAAKARSYLQSFVFRTDNICDDEFKCGWEHA
ncbi:protein MICROTUBULE BINDING PROTEIN 2C [Syzygium oleosum]|uniref:protein MICROTUBULE BINDING PROTEIN 2C n=1 Tax=Syzygium oleosum TaxID=219896 RepID=UPI0024BB4576|nr:protein MICROTUBULE BINDING PROTEIN 2C [Syzygium oleosum]